MLAAGGPTIDSCRTEYAPCGRIRLVCNRRLSRTPLPSAQILFVSLSAGFAAGLTHHRESYLPEDLRKAHAEWHKLLRLRRPSNEFGFPWTGVLSHSANRVPRP